MTDAKGNSENLSEILFKPKRTYLETSLISNSGCPLPDIDLNACTNGFAPNWYRPITRLYWAWSGANPIDIDVILSKICCSNGKRSRETLFDTIIDYGSGNWIYEFASIGQERMLKAKECIANGDFVKASHNYRMAARYFAIAASPNLKGDEIAAEASVLSRNAYRLMFEHEKDVNYEYISFKYGDQKVYAHLHTKDKNDVYPVVVLLPTYEQSSTDFFRFFIDHLRPQGIALIILDMPGVNASANIKLEPNSSDMLLALYEHIKNNIPYLDHTRFGVIGFQIGGTLAARFSILNSKFVKALCLVNPAIDMIFTNQEALNQLSLCQRSSIANRMGFDASNWDTIIPQLQSLSLKRQGLISFSAKCSVPTLCAYLDSEHILKHDSNLATTAFKNSSLNVYHNADFSNGFKFILNDLTKFFTEKLIG